MSSRMNLTLDKHLNGPKNNFGGKKNALKYSNISGNKLNMSLLELLERLQLYITLNLKSPHFKEFLRVHTFSIL